MFLSTLYLYTMRHLPLRFLLSLFLLLPLAACDSGTDDDDDGNGNGNPPSTLGNFSATFGGDLDGSFSGNAFFSVVEDPDLPGGRAFVLFMTDVDLTSGTTTQLTEAVGFLRPGDRPGTGTFDLDDPETAGESGTFGFYINFVNQTTFSGLQGNAGSFTITTSTADSIEGTFNFSGIVFDSANPQGQGAGSISGSFNAVFIDSSDAPDVPTLP